MRRTLFALVLAASTGCASGLNRPVTEVTAKADGDGIQRVHLVAHSFYFAPNRIVVKAGTPVEITLKNAAFGVPHNFSCIAPDADMQMQANMGMFRGTNTVRFTASKPGEYPFFCAVGSHSKKGMTGVIVVTP